MLIKAVTYPTISVEHGGLLISMSTNPHDSFEPFVQVTVGGSDSVNIALEALTTVVTTMGSIYQLTKEHLPSRDFDRKEENN